MGKSNNNYINRINGALNVAANVYDALNGRNGTGRPRGPPMHRVEPRIEEIIALPQRPRRRAPQAPPVVVQPQNQRRARAATSSTGRSGGFLKVRRKVRRKGRVATMLTKGCYKTYETGQVVTSEYLRFLGHSTFCYRSIAEATGIALVKEFFFKHLQITFEDADTFIQLPPFTNITLVYNNDNTTGDVDQTVTWIFGVGAGEWNTPYELAIFISEAMYNTAIQTTDTTWKQLVYKLGSSSFPSATMQLSNASVKLDIKSTLKIQNRSINSAGNDQSDDVDNVPVYGKCFSGKGNGPTAVNEPTGAGSLKTLIGDKVWGVISKDGTEEKFREPMLPPQVTNAKRWDKCKLEPSQIKTSTLTLVKTFKLNSLLRAMMVRSSTVNYPSFKTLGNWKLFSFEKMLEVYPVTIVPMTLAWELNYRVGVAVVGGRLRNMQTNQFNGGAYTFV